MTMETILFLPNHMLTYCITSNHSIEDPYYLHVLGKSTGTTK